MMRLKLIMIMLLAIGIVACTKDDEADYKSDIAKSAADNAVITKMSVGEFEGEWVFAEQVLDTAKLTVTRESFEVRLPVEALLKKNQIGISSHNIDGNPIYKSDDANSDGSVDIEYIYEPRRVTWNYVNHGYSAATNYVYFSEKNNSGDNIVNFLLGNVSMNYKNNGNELNYEVWYSRDQPGVAMFDTFSGLWTLKIEFKITIIYYIEGSDDKIVMEVEPTELVYISKKKIN